MAETLSLGLDRPETGDDAVVPFTLDGLETRGRAIRLGDALDRILKRHAYPAPVARVLGEAVVLASLIGSSLKFKGRFILQTQTDGPINLVVVDFDAPDGIRGYARFEQAELDVAMATGRTGPGELLGHGHLAMTIDQGEHMERYQGIVALEGESLEEVAHTYFMQSEQIPTLVRIAVGELSQRGDPVPHWRAGGMLIQHLPNEGGTAMPDLPGDGDFENPESADPNFVEDDNWTRAKTLLSTVEDAELADPDLSPEQLLYRLYHETGVRVYEPSVIEERCTCSEDRIAGMLSHSFSSEERDEMVVDGQIEVTCEFCSAHYRFNPGRFESN